MSGRPELKLAWCSHEAAKFATSRWHYSKSISSGKNVYIGVWEGEKFVGVIVFGVGSGNVTNGTKYGLAKSHEMAELTRVALTKHEWPVSRMLRIAVAMVKKQSPKLRLLVSMADQREGHHGGIYQGAGWIYTGETKPDVEYFSGGEWRHHRTVTSSRSAKGLPSRPLPPKHRYLMPLDDEIKSVVMKLARPYPKRVESAAGGTPIPIGGGGSIPTSTLQINKDATREFDGAKWSELSGKSALSPAKKSK